MTELHQTTGRCERRGNVNTEDTPKSLKACSCPLSAKPEPPNPERTQLSSWNNTGHIFEDQSLLKKLLKTCCNCTNTLISQVLPITPFVLNNLQPFNLTTPWALSASSPLALHLMRELCSKWTPTAPAPLVDPAPVPAPANAKTASAPPAKTAAAQLPLGLCPVCPGLCLQRSIEQVQLLWVMSGEPPSRCNRATCWNLHFFFYSTRPICHILFSMKYVKDNKNCWLKKNYL